MIHLCLFAFILLLRLIWGWDYCSDCGQKQKIKITISARSCARTALSPLALASIRKRLPARCRVLCLWCQSTCKGNSCIMTARCREQLHLIKGTWIKLKVTTFFSIATRAGEGGQVRRSYVVVLAPFPRKIAQTYAHCWLCWKWKKVYLFEVWEASHMVEIERGWESFDKCRWSRSQPKLGRKEIEHHSSEWGLKRGKGLWRWSAVASVCSRPPSIALHSS